MPDHGKKKTVTVRYGRLFWLCTAWLGLVVVSALAAGFLPLPAFDHMDFNHLAAPPGAFGQAPVQTSPGQWTDQNCLYLLGTDNMGRDIFTRLILGGRISLAVGFLAPLLGLIVGGGLGLSAGYLRGRLDSVITAVMDTILAFPGLVLIMITTLYLGPTLLNMILALSVLIVPSFCRLARANTFKAAEQEYVTAARALGAGDIRIIFKEILPNVIMSLVTYALLAAGIMIVVEGALSFLGLSLPPPTPSWGGMISEGKEVLRTAPHVSLIPAAVLCLTVLSFNLMADRLREKARGNGLT